MLHVRAGPLCVLAMIAACAGATSANTITIEAKTVFSGTTPSGTAPWLTVSRMRGLTP